MPIKHTYTTYIEWMSGAPFLLLRKNHFKIGKYQMKTLIAQRFGVSERTYTRHIHALVYTFGILEHASAGEWGVPEHIQNELWEAIKPRAPAIYQAHKQSEANKE